jgi:hypothetical protein
VLVEYLASVPRLTREVLAPLLPPVTAALRSAVPDLQVRCAALCRSVAVGDVCGPQSAGYMFVVELCARAVLAPELTAALLETVAQRAGDATARGALLCTVMVTQTQPLTAFPVAAFKFLVKLRCGARFPGGGDDEAGSDGRR